MATEIANAEPQRLAGQREGAETRLARLESLYEALVRYTADITGWRWREVLEKMGEVEAKEKR